MDYYELDINKLLGMPKGPDDILQILSTGLNEKQPWALSFADSVFKDLADKIKSLKIESKPIKIDGEAISKEINEGIQENISKDIDKTVESIRDGLKDVSKDLSKIDKKDRINVSSLLGQTPQMGLTTRIKYQGLVKNIISKIEKGLPEKIDLGAVDKLQLNSIFAPPGDTIYPLQGLTLALKWTNLRKDILSKIRPPKKNIILDEKNLSLNSIFAPPGDAIYPLQGLTLALKWTNLRKDILNKIKPPKKNITLEGNNINLNSIFAPPGDAIYPLQGLTLALKWIGLRKDILNKIKPPKKNIVLDESNINLNSIFAPPGDAIYPLQGLTLALKWNNLRKDILNKIKIPRKINISGDTLTLDDIMGVAPRAGILTRMRWGQLQRTIIDKIQKGLNQPEKKISSSQETKKTNIKSEKPIQEKRKIISKEIEEKKSEKIIKPPLTPVTTKPKDFKSLEEKDTSVKISGFTKEAINSLSNLPGLKKVKEITKPEPKKIEKKDSSAMPAWVKMLGLAGVALIGGGLASVTSSMFDSGPFKGMKKLLGTLSIQLGTVFSSFFVKHASKHLGKLITNLSENLVSVLGKVFPKAAETVGKLGGKLGGKLFSIGAKSVGVFLKPILKKLPLIGSIISFGSAFSRFKQGDILGGILDVSSGIASLVPGIGTLLAIGIDVISAVRDIKTPQEQRVKQGASGGIAIFKIIGKAAAKFFAKGMLKRIPIIGSLFSFADAFNMFRQGNILKGLLDVASGIANFFPGIGTAISIGIDVLNSFIKPNEERKNNIQPQTKNTKSIFSMAKEWMHGKIKTIWSKLPAPLKWLLKHHPITGPLIGMLGLDKKDEKIDSKDILFDKQPNISKKNITISDTKTKNKKQETAGDFIKNQMETERKIRENNIKNKTSNNTLPVQKVRTPSAPDFVIRKNQPIQKNQNTDIIATRDEKLFSKLATTIKELHPPQNNRVFEQMHNDINSLVKRMDAAMITMKNVVHTTNKSEAPSFARGELAGISDDAGSSRDPAYILRSRAWDRLRKGYVVL